MTNLMESVCEHLRRTRTVGLIVDHLHRANQTVIDTLVEFAEALDAHQLLQRQNSGALGDEPLTLLFAGTLSPDVLQTDHDEIWATIGGRTAQIAPLPDSASVAVAIETAFGQREYRWSDQAHALFEGIHKETRGLNAHLVTLCQAAAHLLRTETGWSLEGALAKALDEATGGQTPMKSQNEEAAEEVSVEKKPRKGKGRRARHRAASDRRDNAEAASSELRKRGFTGRRAS